MKISVIATFYNQEKWVRKCLDSVLAQQGDFDMEVLAIDDCSSDGTWSVINEYRDERLKPIRQERNRGVSAARNTCLDIMTGDCFFAIDGDDYLPEGALACLAGWFAADVDWVQGGYSVVDEAGNEFYELNYPSAVYGTHGDIVENFEKTESAFIHNRLVNARLKDVRFLEGKQLLEDLTWNMDAFPRVNKIVQVQDSTYCYVEHSGTLSREGIKKREIMEYWLEVLVRMHASEDVCWHRKAVFCQLEWVERNLYLHYPSSAWQRGIRARLRNLIPEGMSLGEVSFKRRFFHNLIISRLPNIVVSLFGKAYFSYAAWRKRCRSKRA